jgi:hypothetical protein
MRNHMSGAHDCLYVLTTKTNGGLSTHKSEAIPCPRLVDLRSYHMLFDHKASFRTRIYFRTCKTKSFKTMLAPLASAAPFLCVCNQKLWDCVVVLTIKQRRFVLFRVIVACYVSCIVALIPYPQHCPRCVNKQHRLKPSPSFGNDMFTNHKNV